MNSYIWNKDTKSLDLSREGIGSVFKLCFNGKDIEVAVVKSSTCKDCVFCGDDEKTCMIENGAHCFDGNIKYVKIAKERAQPNIEQTKPLWYILGRLDGAICMMEKEVLSELMESIVSSLKETRSRLDKFINENLNYENK